MKPTSIAGGKVTITDRTAERGYGAWKRAKIERGLEQSRDRDTLISSEQVWRDLKLER